MKPRILVCGTRSFGAAVVTRLDNSPNCSLICVVAPPDDKCGLHSKARRIPTFPAIDELLVRKYDIDLIVAAHSHAFIGRATRAACRIGAVGFHPSALPRHRGRDAVRWTVHMGDAIAGASVYWLTDNVDGGPLAAQQFVHVDPRWDHHDLWKELFPIGVDMLEQVVVDISLGTMRQAPQFEPAATWEPSWDRQPLHRPELYELGRMPDGMKMETKL